MSVSEIELPDAVNEKQVGYSVRPGFKQTEIGLIPNDWNDVPLGRIASFRTGPFGSSLHMSDYVFDGIPVVNPMQIVGGKVVPTCHMTITEAMASRLSDFRLKSGEIIIGRRGEMGRCSVITDVQSGWLCGTGSMIIRVRKENSASLVCRLLSSAPIVAAIENASVGTTMVNLNNATMSGLKLPLPSTLAEQEAIAEALGDADALVESLERLLAKKRNLKQAAMQQLLTGKKRLPGFEGEWETATLGELTTFLSGGTPSRKNEDYWSGDIPWISASSLRCFEIWRSDSCVTAQAVAAGSKMAPVGSSLMLVRGSALHKEILCGLVTKPVCFNQDVKALVPNMRVVPLFLTFAIRAKTEEILKLVSSAGNTAGVLDTKLLQAFEINLPSPDEQNAIATVLLDMDEEIAAIEAKIDKARQVKAGMMQELLTGKTRLV